VKSWSGASAARNRPAYVSVSSVSADVHIHVKNKFKCREMLLTEYCTWSSQVRKGILRLLGDSCDTPGLAEGLVFPKKVQFQKVRFEISSLRRGP